MPLKHVKTGLPTGPSRHDCSWSFAHKGDVAYGRSQNTGAAVPRLSANRYTTHAVKGRDQQRFWPHRRIWLYRLAKAADQSALSSPWRLQHRAIGRRYWHFSARLDRKTGFGRVFLSPGAKRRCSAALSPGATVFDGNEVIDFQGRGASKLWIARITAQKIGCFVEILNITSS